MESRGRPDSAVADERNNGRRKEADSCTGAVEEMDRARRRWVGVSADASCFDQKSPSPDPDVAVVTGVLEYESG